jgi:hypothetical protein
MKRETSKKINLMKEMDNGENVEKNKSIYKIEKRKNQKSEDIKDIEKNNYDMRINKALNLNKTKYPKLMNRFEVLSGENQSEITNSDTERDDKMSLNYSLNAKPNSILEKRKNAKPFEVMAIKKKKKTNKSRIPGIVTENVHIKKMKKKIKVIYQQKLRKI